MVLVNQECFEADYEDEDGNCSDLFLKAVCSLVGVTPAPVQAAILAGSDAQIPYASGYAGHCPYTARLTPGRT